MRRGLTTGIALALFLAGVRGSVSQPSDPAAADSGPGRRAASPVPAGPGVPALAVTSIDGIAVVGANDLARLLGASRSWRADVRKLELLSGAHRLTFTDGNPFVIADDRTLRLEHAVFSRGGELQIPVELAGALPEDAGWPRLAYDEPLGELRAAPAAGFIGSPRVLVRAGVTELEIPADGFEAAEVVDRGKPRFRVRIPGGFVGELPDSLPDDGLLRDLSVSPSPSGIVFELTVDPSASGWRLERAFGGGGVSVLLARDPGGMEPFAPEPPAGARALRTVVLDPGHGGIDTGVQSDGVLEKTLTLDLARALSDELRRRLGVRVALTRSDDRDLSQLGRAELANRPDPDLVISLHFGMSVDPRTRGGTVWCAPASVPPAMRSVSSPGTDLSRDVTAAAGLLELLPWRDAATSHAVTSRDLGDDLVTALERQGFGPIRVHERMPMALVGVDAPGVMLECGTLSNAAERVKLLAPNGLKRLAAAIADGLIAWQRGE